MRKSILLSAIIFSISFFTNAQVVRFGVDPGIALSRDLYNTFSGDRKIYAGFDGGALVQIGAQRTKFQAEVNYSMIGVKLNNGTTEYTIKHTYINIPVLAKFAMVKVNLLTGLQIGF